MGNAETQLEAPTLPARFTGGCHCGRVRFVVTLRRFRMSECNCSLCTKKGFLHLIIDKSDLEIVAGREALSTYTFNTHVARHHFCSTCGIHPFYVPRSHPDGYSVNARCLEDVRLAWFELLYFDGQNWEAQIETYSG